MKKLIDKALNLLTCKGGKAEMVTAPPVRVSEEQAEAYITGRWRGLRDGGGSKSGGSSSGGSKGGFGGGSKSGGGTSGG